MNIQAAPACVHARDWQILYRCSTSIDQRPRNSLCCAEANRLLRVLYARGEAPRHLEAVQLEARQILGVPEQPTQYVYFPRTAVVLLLVPMEDGSAIEGATVGNEGLLGLQVLFGQGAPREEIVVEIPGEAARMPVADFREAVEQNATWRILLYHYTLALMNQLARTAGCNRLHMVEERCARLLLMCRDRVGRNTFPLTHEALSTILGVRRASVTQAAGALQRSGMIHYHRGEITIVDDRRLEAAACEDYRLSRAAYDQLFAWERWTSLALP